MDLNSLLEIKHSLAPLTGDGLCLRLLTAADLPSTIDWRNREDIRHYFIRSEIIAWENHLSWWEKYQSKTDDFTFIIEDTGRLKRPVGQIALYNLDLVRGEAEYGRLMVGDPEARRKGLAKRATFVLVSWAFTSLGLKRIYLNVLKTNTAAINLYRQSGFTICGEHEELITMHMSESDYHEQILRTASRIE